MKNQMLLLSILFLLAGLSIGSCKKIADQPVTIVGKWSIITDSTYTQLGCCTQHRTFYSGHYGDYFDFLTNGKLNTKEGTNLNSVDYKLTSDTSIVIGPYGYIYILNLTAHHAQINSNTITFGISGWRRISLSR